MTLEPGAGRRSLSARIEARIRREGPITFAAFMEAALYDGSDGFYRRTPVGERGDFVTSPHVSPVFGLLLAHHLEEAWELLDKPEPFWVVELGAGDGTLARHILDATEPALARSISYIAVDRSAGARAALGTLAGSLEPPARLTVAPDLAGAAAAIGDRPARRVLSGGAASEEPRPRSGCVIANELLDNVPFQRVRGTSEGVVELLVGHDGDRFVLVEGPLLSGRIREIAPSLEPGEEAAVSPDAFDLVREAAALLDRGYVLLIDYAAGGTPASALVHGYRSHRLEADVLEDPGSRDITAGVDFGAITRHGTALGLSVWGPVTQRDALLNLGYRAWDEEARLRQTDSAAERRGFDTMRTYSARSKASLLVDPFGLGGFQVLCLGVDVREPTSATRHHAGR